jgi:hypothetical protein
MMNAPNASLSSWSPVVSIHADFPENHGFEFTLETARRPNCRAEISKKSSIGVAGGPEGETTA